MKNKKIIAGYLIIILALAGGTVGIKYYDKNQEKQQEVKIQELNQELADKQSEAYAKSEEIRQQEIDLLSANNNIASVDVSRTDRDKTLAESIMKTVLGWTDYESYMSARNVMINTYGISEDSHFLSQFMPSVFQTDPTLNGSVYNTIDLNGYNAYYEDMTQYFLGEDNGVYRYLAEVNWITVTSIGGEAQQDSVFTYQIDENNKLLDMDAYMISTY